MHYIIAILVLLLATGVSANPLVVLSGSPPAAGGGTTWGPTAISADANDGFNEAGTWRAGFDPIEIGQVFGDIKHGGFRFLNVTVPQGTTITSATLSLHAQANKTGAGNVLIRIMADDVDTAAALATASMPPSSGWTQTTANADFTVSTWAVNTRYQYDVTTIVQEIISRAGWASGNAIRIGVIDNGTANGNVLNVSDFGGVAANAATLTIVY